MVITLFLILKTGTQNWTPYNINNHYPIWNRDELNGYIKCFKETYDNINLLYEQNRKCKMKQEAYKAILDTLPFTQFLTTDGYINYFAIDNYIDNEFIKGYYQNSVNLYRAFSDNEVFSLSSYHNNHYKLGDYERLHRENNAISLKAKRKILVKQLEILGDCSTELDLSFKEELRQVDKLIVEAYDKLGKAKIEELRYNSKKIKREIILTDYHNKARGNEAQKLLNLDFQIGAWYSAENIKSKLKQICKDLDMKPLKAVTSHTILDFFEAKPQQRGKKRGYLIIRKKFI